MAYVTPFWSKFFGKFTVKSQIYKIDRVPSLKSMGWVGPHLPQIRPGFYGFPTNSIDCLRLPPPPKSMKNIQYFYYKFVNFNIVL